MTGNTKKRGAFPALTPSHSRMMDSWIKLKAKQRCRCLHRADVEAEEGGSIEKHCCHHSSEVVVPWPGVREA